MVNRTPGRAEGIPPGPTRKRKAFEIRTSPTLPGSCSPKDKQRIEIKNQATGKVFPERVSDPLYCKAP